MLVELYLWVSKQMKSNDIQMQNMLGYQEPLSKDNPPTGKEAKVHNDPWGNDMVWYDAMRDLRDKIGVLQHGRRIHCIRISSESENQSLRSSATYGLKRSVFGWTTLLRNLPDARPLETYSPVVEGVNVFLGEEKSMSLGCLGMLMQKGSPRWRNRATLNDMPREYIRNLRKAVKYGKNKVPRG